MAKKSFSNLHPKGKSALGAALSGANELFYLQTNDAHEVRQEQGRAEVQLGNGGDPHKITIKLTPKD